MVNWEREDSVEFMLSLGADPNVIDSRYGTTPIFHAAFRGKKKISQLLISRGADVNARSNDGRTALHFIGGAPEVFALLISKGADIDARDDDGNTPLHHTAMSGDTIVAQLLISVSADLSIKNNKGQTALELAEERDSRGVIWLLEHSCHE